MNKILDVMEDLKQNITDSQYKTIMDSFMEIKNGKENILRFYYRQQEFDEMTKVMVKLSIDIFYEYTDDENDSRSCRACEGRRLTRRLNS